MFIPLSFASDDVALASCIQIIRLNLIYTTHKSNGISTPGPSRVQALPDIHNVSIRIASVLKHQQLLT